MINKELFYEITRVPRDIKLKPAPRLIAKPGATAACILEKGISRIVSWFWKSGDIVIPSSPYSNLIMTDDGKYSHK